MTIPKSELDEFGKFLERYRIDLPSQNIPMLVGLFIWFSWGFLYTFIPGDVFLRVLGIIFLTSGVYFLYKTIRFQSKQRYLLFYEHGIVVEEKNKRRLAGYQKLKVWQKNTKLYNPPLPTSYSYVTQFSDGTRIFITQKHIGELLQKMIVEHQLPQAMTTYWQGDDVQFGSIRLNREEKEIVVGRKKIPWSKVEKVTIKGGYIYIKNKNSILPGISISVAEVPNVHILLHLLKTILQERFEG